MFNIVLKTASTTHFAAVEVFIGAVLTVWDVVTQEPHRDALSTTFALPELVGTCQAWNFADNTYHLGHKTIPIRATKVVTFEDNTKYIKTVH